jgi:hypothetical protein
LEEMMDQARRDALMKEYGEVGSSFRMLTDIRFKLLAFLPIAAASAAALKGDNPGPTQLALSLFGLVVTIGLVTYNSRNDQLYDELVGRAAAIERSLGLVDGAFAHRPQPWLKLRVLKAWRVDHRTAVSTIYSASIALWLYGTFTPLLEWGRRAYVRRGFSMMHTSEPSTWTSFSAMALAILVVGIVGRSIAKQRTRRELAMRRLARDAVKRAMEGDPDDVQFIRICAELADIPEATLRRRFEFYTQKLAVESRPYFMPASPDENRCAHLVALLTDLSPRWILDCYTDRRGALIESVQPYF